MFVYTYMCMRENVFVYACTIVCVYLYVLVLKKQQNSEFNLLSLNFFWKT